MTRKPLGRILAAIGILCAVYVWYLASGASSAGTPGHIALTSNHMPMVMATAPDSFTAKSDPIPQTSWTATASDQQSSHLASSAIDGDSTTFWETNGTSLPQSITINMGGLNYVSGLTYLPRQDGSNEGNIGRYAISVSSDGKAWSRPVAGGTWADDSTLKTAVFGGIRCRYVRLTALTEASSSGPFAAAAEIGLLSDPPIGPALPRTGWTVTADSQNSAAEAASNVLDGDGMTMWHTAYSTQVAPLPHWITIDMHGTHLVSALAYLPRQDGNSNGNIGQYAVATSTDGVHWTAAVTGTWADDATQKFATFRPTSARFVRLTALSEAGNRGPWTSAAELNVLGVAPRASVGGRWSAPIGFPIVPVSVVTLPNDKLLTFSADEAMTFDLTPDTITNVAVLDLRTGVVSEPIDVNTHHQMFCEGLAMLPNGSVLINGGSNDKATTIYNPYTNTWTQGPLMNIPRAYEGDTTLSTGQVLTLGGSWYDAAGDKNGEIYTANGGAGNWRELPGVLASKILTADPAGVWRADNHVWLFGQANGTVFQAGPSKQMNWISTTGNGSISAAGNRGTSADAMNGNAVMYDVGKILTVGGARAYQDSGSLVDVQATRRAYTVNITGGPRRPVKVLRVGNMAFARAFSNSVVLPNGEVLVVGGQQHPQPFADTGAALSPELWNPATGKFTIMAPELIPRTYHSVAILLPDGRVFSGGGGLCGGCTTNHPDGQIFSPPYLFNAKGGLRHRPVIDRAPARATTGETITVKTNSVTPRFALIRMSAVTHTVNNDQRRIPLTPVKVSGTRYTLRLPASTGVLLPGNYMLFALYANGTPSVAKIINIR